MKWWKTGCHYSINKRQVPLSIMSKCQGFFKAWCKKMLVISIFMVEVDLNEKTEAKNADDPSILRNHSER